LGRAGKIGAGLPNHGFGELPVKLEFTLNEINVIMQALGQMPFASVFELVTKIREQAQAQLAQQEVPSDA
jgi:hypothetical protein